MGGHPGRTTTALAIAIVATLATSSGYALAGKPSHAIRACAAKSNGALRVAKHCKHSERAISWNAGGPRGATGPAGPGATLRAYSSSSPTTDPTPTPTKVGTIGPWTLYGTCAIDNLGTVRSTAYYSGPAVLQDTSATTSEEVSGDITTTDRIYSAVQAAMTAAAPGMLGQASSGGTEGAAEDVSITWISAATKLSQTLIVTATSTANGDPANSCHWSSVTVPLKAG